MSTHYHDKDLSDGPAILCKICNKEIDDKDGVIFNNDLIHQDCVSAIKIKFPSNEESYCASCDKTTQDQYVKGQLVCHVCSEGKAY